MVANKYAFLQITRRRFMNEWEAFKKVISRRNIRRRITIPLTLSNLKLLRRITRTENILHRNFTRRQVAIQNRVSSFFFFQAEDGIRDRDVTGVQTCALPISPSARERRAGLSARPLPGDTVGDRPLPRSRRRGRAGANVGSPPERQRPRPEPGAQIGRASCRERV